MDYHTLYESYGIIFAMKCASTSDMIRTLDMKSVGFNWLLEIASVYSRRALRMEWHRHDGDEVICCTQGEMAYEFRRHEPVIITSGNFLVIPSGTEHRLSSGIDAPCRRISFVLRRSVSRTSPLTPFSAEDYAEFTSEILKKRYRQNRLPSLSCEKLNRLGEFIHRSPTRATSAERCEIRLLACAILLDCASIPETVAAMDSSEIMDKAVEWMEEHFAESVDIDRLVRHIGYGRTQFFRLFKDKTGHTPSDYLIQLRIRKAMELLGTGRRTVRETAAEVGFADASFFTRTFTRRVGTPPSKWAQHAAQTLSDKDGQPSRGGRGVP